MDNPSGRLAKRFPGGRFQDGFPLGGRYGSAMRLPFNEKKATQAAAYLLRLRGGRMSYMKLIKLLYLADRLSLTRRGRPITTDRYVSMDRGPVLSRTLNLITEDREPAAPSFWAEFIAEPSNFEVELKSDPGADELSQS